MSGQWDARIERRRGYARRLAERLAELRVEQVGIEHELVDAFVRPALELERKHELLAAQIEWVDAELDRVCTYTPPPRPAGPATPPDPDPRLERRYPRGTP